MQSSTMLRSRAMPAAGTASTSSRASRPSALVVRARTQVLEEGKAPKESRVGKVPIAVPSGTNVTLETAYIKVKVRTFSMRSERECETGKQREGRKMRERDAAWLFLTANPDFHAHDVSFPLYFSNCQLIHRDPRASSSSTTLTSSRSKR